MSKVQQVLKTISTITGYKTSDDRVFEKLQEAQEWQDYLDYKEKLYNIFDSIFEDWLDEHYNRELPFNEETLNQILKFMVANLNLDNLIVKLTEVQNATNKR